MHVIKQTGGNKIDDVVPGDPSFGTTSYGPGAIQENHLVDVTANLIETGTGATLDSGTFAQATWSPTAQLSLVVQSQAQGSGGLTTDQALQLQQVHDSTAPLISLDPLTLVDLTPGGPSAGPINAQLPTPIFGVIVRLASVPPELTPQTPDGDYWLTTLAVVRVFRGADLWQRVPVHTSNKMVPLEGEGFVSAVAAAFTNLWLLQMSIQVTFLPGVTGTVFLMRFP